MEAELVCSVMYRSLTYKLPLIQPAFICSSGAVGLAPSSAAASLRSSGSARFPERAVFLKRE